MRLALSIFVALFMLGTPAAHAATKAECDLLRGNNPDIVCNESTPITDVDKSLGITDQAAKAKQYLLSIARNLRGSKAPPTCAPNIYRLNNTFAVCSASFLNAYQSVYGEGSVYVVSAFRPPEDLGDGCGSNAAAGGALHSNHMYGRAMDVAPTGGRSTFKTLQKFARDNPQFGVCFPYLPEFTGSNFYDAPHMALAGIDTGEARLCARQGITNYCNGAPEFDASQVNPQYAGVTETEDDHSSLGAYVTPSNFSQASVGPTVGYTTSGHATGEYSAPITGNDINYNDLFSSGDMSSGQSTPNTSGSLGTQTGFSFTPYTFNPVATRDTHTPIEGSTTASTCRDLGLFGMTLFNTCADNGTNAASTGADTTATKGGVLSWASRFTGGHATTDTQAHNGVPPDVRSGAALDVFYGVHKSTNTTGFTGDNYASYERTGEFVAGDAQPVAPTISGAQIATDSARLAEQSVRYGAYFGLIHGLSPMMVGSAPRTLLRTVKFVYNPEK